jgi:diacylglycerol kinase family enzyme
VAAAGLAGSETALAVLPSGTTNVWAQELGLPKIKSPRREEVCAVADLIAQSQPRRMDVGACNGKPFLLWAGIGLDALVVRHSEQKRSHLKKRFAIPEYILRAFRAAATWEGISATVRADCATGVSQFEGRFQLAVVSNIRLYAGGLAEISPEARLDDGEMDLWLFDGSGASGALRSAWNILRRAHVNQPGVRRVRFRQVNVELASPAALHSDGEPCGDHRSVELSVTRQALKILVPPTAHAPRFENP